MSSIEFNESLKSSVIAHAKADYEKMHQIAKHIYENPSEIDAFAKEPEAWSFRFNGFMVQDGHHLHIADENNTLIPAEEYGVFGAEERPVWGRAEVRVGYKTVSLVECM